MAESETEQVLNEIANLVAGGGFSNSRGKGRCTLFRVPSATRLAPRNPVNFIITAIELIGTNICVSTSGTTFNQTNVSSYQDATILAWINNSVADIRVQHLMNVRIPMADDPNAALYIDNGGAGIGTVIIYWDLE